MKRYLLGPLLGLSWGCGGALVETPVEPAAPCASGRVEMEARGSLRGAPFRSVHPNAGRPLPDPLDRFDFFTGDTGGMFIRAESSVQPAQRREVDVLLRLPGVAQDQFLCGRGSFEWEKDQLYKMNLSEAAALPACGQGTPLVGEIELCSNSSEECGAFSTIRSTIEGHEFEAQNFEVGFSHRYEGESRALARFSLEGISGIVHVASGRGFGLLADGTVICIGELELELPLYPFDPLRMKLRGVERIGRCAEQAQSSELNVQVCLPVREDPRS